MAKYVIKRVLMGIFSMFIVATLTFFIMNLVPGGPFVAEKSISLAAQQDYRFGISYTPNRFDLRSALKRWTYKAGLRYSDSYLVKNGNQLHDAAVSLGVEFGLRKGTFSTVGVGVEYGERGSRAAGQVQERYFNIFLSLGLFGKDYWFVRPKYN